MRCRYAATCRGCTFLIGWNTSPVTSLIVGIATDAPTCRHQLRCPDSYALGTAATH